MPLGDLGYLVTCVSQSPATFRYKAKSLQTPNFSLHVIHQFWPTTCLAFSLSCRLPFCYLSQELKLKANYVCVCVVCRKAINVYVISRQPPQTWLILLHGSSREKKLKTGRWKLGNLFILKCTTGTSSGHNSMSPRRTRTVCASRGLMKAMKNIRVYTCSYVLRICTDCILYVNIYLSKV